LALRPVLEEAREKLEALISVHRLSDESVEVKLGTLSVKQAIGSPARQDFALLEGKEVMIEAEFRGSFGQAFTDKPGNFAGSLGDILKLNLDSNDARAIFVSTLNAVASHLKIVDRTRHCRDEEPEECATKIAEKIKADFGDIRIGLVGLQPAILERLVRVFGADRVQATDLNPKNIGSSKFGVKILDGRSEVERLVKWCDILLVTTSSIVNNTLDEIRERAIHGGKRLILFGVTGAGVASLLNLEIMCFHSH
jgi:hypothetical protein